MAKPFLAIEPETLPEVRVLVLRQGDGLALRVPGPLSDAAISRLQQSVCERLQGHGVTGPVLVLEEGLDISHVIRKDPHA